MILCSKQTSDDCYCILVRLVEKSHMNRGKKKNQSR